MTYGCQTWSLNKQLTNKLRTAQRAIERKMFDLQLQDKIPCSEMSKRTKRIDIMKYTLKQMWKWAGHIARMKDNRWTKRCTEWQPRREKRSRGRPSRRWQDDCNGPRVMQRRERDRKKNSTCNLTTVRVHVSGVFTQRTQISPLTLDVTTNRYFIVQRGMPNIF